jgi:hypothetical protein
VGKIRPPGPFSFVSGVVAYFSLAAAFMFHGWLERRVYARWLLWLATAVITLAIPISISRTLLFSLLVVVAFGLAVAMRDLRRIPAYAGPLLAAAAVLAAISESTIMSAYRVRWEESMDANGGGIREGVVVRLVDEVTKPFSVAADAPLLGYGIGMGTVAGARLATGKMGFALAESELARIVLELGPVLGFLFIGWRLWLALLLVVKNWHCARTDGDVLPWMLTGACVLLVVNGQWGPATNLGFAVFGAGLALAAGNRPETALK